MSNAAQLNSLLSDNKREEAIAFCKKMQKDFPSFSYYKYWYDRLTKEGGSEQNVLSAIGSNISAPANKLSLNALSAKIRMEFERSPYTGNSNLEISDDPKALQEEKAALVKSFPFSGDIYLPTEKIQLNQQIIGLRQVKSLVSQENRAVSTQRWVDLKKIIERTGKKRVFILGNGPSLRRTDLRLLKDEITIGFNGIFLHDYFVPTIHIVEDHLVAEDRIKELVEFECPVKMFPSYLGYCLPVQENTLFLNHLSRQSFPVDTDFSADAGKITYTGGTVTYTGLQVAASLGFSEIYLLGVDASYKVENVERSTDYGTGVLESKSDDINHFDTRYFGKGFRWHDPNVNTMLQAYRKARIFAETHNTHIKNATLGGQLEVFPRVNYYDLFPRKISYPKTAILDFTHINWLCATGIVKKNMFAGWSPHSQLHVHSQNPNAISTFQTAKDDCYAAGADKKGLIAALRSIAEYDPEVLYLRPTHDRPALALFQMLIPFILNRPYVIHYMDDWLAKIRALQGDKFAEIFNRVMSLLFIKANRVLTISSKMSLFLEKEFAVPPEKLQVVHNYIQPSKVENVSGKPSHKTLRYFGGMEADMSLDAITLVAQAVETLHQRHGQDIRFEIYTSANHIEKNKSHFDKFRQTSINLSLTNYDNYLAHLKSSDINFLCYNFNKMSETYLRYSMANKLPEIIGANTPFIAIGSPEIGTITYLQEEKFPHIVAKNDVTDVEKMIEHVLFDKDSVNDAYFEVLNTLKEEFSESRNAGGFQSQLRQASQESPLELSAQDIQEIENLSILLLDLLGERKEQYMADIYILKQLFSLPLDMRRKVVERIGKHGVTWHFKTRQKAIEKSILNAQKNPNVTLTSDEKTDALAFAVVSLQHDRFRETNQKIYDILPSFAVSH